MPTYLERHGKADDYASSQPSRSETVRLAAGDDPDPARRHGHKKDTSLFCGGKPGRWHEPETIKGNERWAKSCAWRTDYSDRPGSLRWLCLHEIRCASCGKVLTGYGSMTRSQCPDFGLTAEATRKSAEIQSVADWERWEARRARPSRRQAIAGPQGYRRKRPT